MLEDAAGEQLDRLENADQARLQSVWRRTDRNRKGNLQRFAVTHCGANSDPRPSPQQRNAQSAAQPQANEGARNPINVLSW
jgi:hypothetical protein